MLVAGEEQVDACGAVWSVSSRNEGRGGPPKPRGASRATGSCPSARSLPIRSSASGLTVQITTTRQPTDPLVTASLATLEV